MEFKKTIGKMGSVAKSKAKETFTKQNAKTFIHEAGNARNKLANYAERVDRNASTSWLINTPPPPPQQHKPKRRSQPITIVINNQQGRRKRKTRKPRSAPHFGPF